MQILNRRLVGDSAFTAAFTKDRHIAKLRADADRLGTQGLAMLDGSDRCVLSSLLSKGTDDDISPLLNRIRL